jgi:ElaB/YqjD/DUF883 family membrane-anchored ribosome-binding protein
MKATIPPANGDNGTLVEDIRTLIANTADLAGDQASEVRQCLADAFDQGSQVLARARANAGEGAQATGQAVRDHPYKAAALALAAGILIGDLIARRASRTGK